MLIIVAAALAACEFTPDENDAARAKIDLEHHRVWTKADQDAIAACVKRGGIPVRSDWDGMMKACK